jgi:hypothetical protein
VHRLPGGCLIVIGNSASVSAAAASLNAREPRPHPLPPGAPSPNLKPSPPLSTNIHLHHRQTCRWMAPETFTAVGMQAAVTRQPATQEEKVRALQALVSCPV